MKTEKIDKLGFEEALDRLEKIILILQDGNLTLEESLKVYEEGIRLVRICQLKLDTTESKISLLLSENDGKTAVIPFSMESED